MSRATVLWWVRRDLRLGDNPALNAAAAAGRVVPVFVVDPALWGPSGPARRAFLVGCLHSLDRAVGGHLVIRHGDPATEIPRLARQAEAEGVYAAADFGPYGRRRDEAVERHLTAQETPLTWIGSPYAVEPGAVVKGDGSPFRVFTPFRGAWLAHGWGPPVARPPRVAWAHDLPSDAIPDAPNVDATLPPAGEEAASRQWDEFSHGALDAYDKQRNIPAGQTTSRMSPYLKWGCIHPRTLLADLAGSRRGHAMYRSELCWREFYADVLFRQPESARQSLQPRMAKMEVDTGDNADERFAAWVAGRTGFPIVDAGMRQLLVEGWIHNRVRMIVASFLVKDLHIDWRRGARHFLLHLVDGDLASNNHGWQWVAGTGTDAAPYYRIFNPTLQGRKFDPDGEYIRKYVPELAAVAARDIHAPWEAATLPLDASRYPAPMVDHHAERQEALDRYANAAATTRPT